MFATEAQADREYATNVGAQRRDQEWILSDRDVWYRNPFYKGAPGRHPEDDSDLFDELLSESCANEGLDTDLSRAPVTGCHPGEADDIWGDDLPY